MRQLLTQIAGLFSPILFMLSAGLYFSDRERKNILIVFVTGIIGVVSTIFTFEQMIERIKSQEDYKEIEPLVVSTVALIAAAVAGAVIGRVKVQGPELQSVSWRRIIVPGLLASFAARGLRRIGPLQRQVFVQVYPDGDFEFDVDFTESELIVLASRQIQKDRGEEIELETMGTKVFP